MLYVSLQLRLCLLLLVDCCCQAGMCACCCLPLAVTTGVSACWCLLLPGWPSLPAAACCCQAGGSACCCLKLAAARLASLPIAAARLASVPAAPPCQAGVTHCGRKSHLSDSGVHMPVGYGSTPAGATHTQHNTTQRQPDRQTDTAVRASTSAAAVDVGQH